MRIYNWDDVPEDNPLPGLRRRAIRSSNAMVVRNELDPGMKTHPHSHDFEQLCLVVSGHVRFTLGEEVHEIGPGSMFLIPAGIKHFAEPFGEDVVINIDVFSPVRPDYFQLVEYQEEKFGP